MINWNHYLHTERLVLQERTDELMQQVLEQDQTEQLFFFGYQTTQIVDLERELTWIKKGFSSWKANCKMWNIIGKEEQVVIGHCGYHSWYQTHRRAEIGYALHPAFRGKGYMKETLLTIIKHGFTKMQLNRIEAFVGPTNVPSIKLIEHFGFVKEGLMRSHYLSNGVMDDSVIYALLQSEYLERNKLRA